MTRATFAIDLSEYDVSEFENNPIVLLNFDYNSLPVGKAKVAQDKKSVEVQFYPEHPIVSMLSSDFSHISISESYDKDKTLVALSVTNTLKRRD